MLILSRASFVLLAVLLLAGCDDWVVAGLADRYKEDFHFTYPLSTGGRLEMETFNGSVEISGWDQNTVDIAGTKYASTQNRLKDLKIEVSPSPNSIVIRTVRPLSRLGNAGARFVIRVPRRTELASISSSNGSIRVESVEGMARLKTSNGAVRTRGATGGLDIRTSNAAVEVLEGTGANTLHSSNGSIHAEVRRGSLDASTSNGAITARLLESDSKPVRLESSNGRIEVDMDRVRDVRVETSNASITVRLPSDAGAELHARTSHGNINCDFGVTTEPGAAGRPGFDKHRLEGTIGKGGPLLDLVTSNGSIRLSRL